MTTPAGMELGDAAATGNSDTIHGKHSGPSSHRLALSQALMLLLVLGVGTVSVVFGERIPERGGLGWDGAIYGDAAQHFYQSVFIDGYDRYYVHRVLPAGIVHYTLRAVGLPQDVPHVITAFAVYDVILAAIAVLLWWHIADQLTLSLRGRWLGFTGLFVNYALMKFVWYYPVLTDVSAFTLGALMLYLYLKDRTWLLFLAALVGAFTWPIASLVGGVLLTFPRRAIPPPALAPSPDTRLATIAAFAVVGFLLAGFAYLYYIGHERVAGWGPVVPIFEPLLYVSLCVYAAYVFAATRILFTGIDRAYGWRVLHAVRPHRLILAGLAILLPQALVAALPQSPPPEFTFKAFLHFLIILPVARPFVFFVSHVVYFGPVMLLFLWLWPKVCQLLREEGPGMILVGFAGLLIGLTPESRQSMLTLPMIVPFLVKAADRQSWPASASWFLGLAAVAFSKVWMPLHPPGGALLGRTLEPSYYRYFISQGPYMPNDAFAVQSIAVLATGAMLYWLLRSGRHVVRNAVPVDGTRVPRMNAS